MAYLMIFCKWISWAFHGFGEDSVVDFNESTVATMSMV